MEEAVNSAFSFLKWRTMRKTIKTIVIYIGIDVLGFPQHITHQKEDYEAKNTHVYRDLSYNQNYRLVNAGPQGVSRFFNPYTKK